MIVIECVHKKTKNVDNWQLPFDLEFARNNYDSFLT